MTPIVIQLLGTLTVTGPNGENLTPKGGKVGALLALLSVAKGRRCTRAWIQDKLWSDRGHQQGRDSLRHAISDLKKSLGCYASLLVVERRELSIDRNAVIVDLYDAIPGDIATSLPGAEFLEGIDVKDREFECWLRQMRMSLLEKPVTSPKHEDLSILQSGFHVALLPIESFGHSHFAVSLSTEILSRVASSLENLGPFSIFDFTSSTADDAVKPVGPDVFLLTRCVDYGDCVSLSLSLRRAVDNKVIWSAMQTIPYGREHEITASAMVIQVTDQIAKILHKPGVLGPADRHQAARLALSGIDNLFSLNPNGLLEADSSFAKAAELENKDVYYAWRAYSIVIRASELRQENGDELRRVASALAEQALAINKNNPLTLALLTQVYAFVFRDFNKAQTLIEPAIAMKSDSLMALDSLALLNFYTGNIEKAREAATQAENAAVCNPYRYGFATTLCMIDTVSGDYQSAIVNGERALAMQTSGSLPKYAPTLRYLCAAYDRAGRADDAKRTYRQLKEQEPCLNADAMDQDEYPLPNADAHDILKECFSRIEATLDEDISNNEPDTSIN